MPIICSPFTVMFTRAVMKVRKTKRDRNAETPDLTDMCTVNSPSYSLSSSPRHTVDDPQNPIWPPPGPRAILASREHYSARYTSRRLRVPEDYQSDCSLFFLYRIYEWLITGNLGFMHKEMDMFWWSRIPVSTIPDPYEQGDPERYAVLACTAALVVECFNIRNDMGFRRVEPQHPMTFDEQVDWARTDPVLEELPFWAQNVRPIEETLHMPLGQTNHVDILSKDDPNASPIFKEKNILIRDPPLPVPTLHRVLALRTERARMMRQLAMPGSVEHVEWAI